MKKIVNSNMVAHLWANQSQSEAYTSNRNFFFRDTTIYSYGSHFPIARHVKGVVLFTNRSYSTTTAKHKSIVYRAANHLTLIHCNNPQAESEKEHKANLFEMRQSCYDTLAKAARARSHAEHLFNRAEELAANHLDYRRLFGLDLDEVLTISEEWKKEAQGRIAAQAALAKEHRILEAKKEAERKLEALKDLELWKTGEIIARSGFRNYGIPIALRLSSDGNEIQTSEGAEIPKAHGLRLWKKVKAIKESGIAYHRNGHTEYAGSFAVDSIESDGTMKAGCHTITFEAMAELAQKLGW